jgi:F420-dependent oxidoreductase-like protein
MFEMSFDRPARHMREYLDILLPLLSQGAVDTSGATVSYHGDMQVPGASPCQVMLAALGPKMLTLCGARTHGTITWMTGADTIKDYIRPAIIAAAENAGRQAPRIAALLPIIITDDEKGGRKLAASQFAIYGQMPSYRAMLDKSGLAKPEDYVLIGNEDEVAEGLRNYAAAGVTDCGLLVAGTGEYRTRGLEFVQSLQGALT